MSKFIQVTEIGTKSVVYGDGAYASTVLDHANMRETLINAAHILEITKNDESTYLTFNVNPECANRGMSVKETPEQILAQIGGEDNDRLCKAAMAAVGWMAGQMAHIESPEAKRIMDEIEEAIDARSNP